jgi:hypothetical protein
MKPAAAPCRVALPCTQPRTPRHAPTTRLPHTRHTTGRAQVPHHPVQPAQARREGLQDPQRLPVQLHHVRQLHRRDLGLDPVHARHADGGRRAVHGGGRLPDGGVGARQAQAAGQGVRGPRAGGGGGAAAATEARWLQRRVHAHAVLLITATGARSITQPRPRTRAAAALALPLHRSCLMARRGVRSTPSAG